MQVSAKKEKLLHVLHICYTIGLCAYPVVLIGMGLFTDQGDSWWTMEWWQLSLFLLIFTFPIFVAWLVTFPSIRYLSLRQKSKAAPKCEAALSALCTAMPICSLLIFVVWFFSLMGYDATGTGALMGAFLNTANMIMPFLFFGLPVISVGCGIAALILHQIVKKKETIAFYEQKL